MKRTVIIVDNDRKEETFVKVKTALQVCSLTWTICFSDKDAISFVEAYNPCLVMVDVFLDPDQELLFANEGRFPNGGVYDILGLKVADDIKSCFPQTPVLLMSGYKPEEVLEAAIGREVDGFLWKNGDIDRIASTINSITNLYQAPFEPMYNTVRSVISSSHTYWQRKAMLESAAKYFEGGDTSSRLTSLWISMLCHFRSDRNLSELAKRAIVAADEMFRLVRSAPVSAPYCADVGLIYWLGYLILNSGMITDQASADDINRAWILACVFRNFGHIAGFCSIICAEGAISAMWGCESNPERTTELTMNEKKYLLDLFEKNEDVNVQRFGDRLNKILLGDKLNECYGMVSSILFLKMKEAQKISAKHNAIVEYIVCGLAMHDLLNHDKQRFKEGWQLSFNSCPLGYMFALCDILQPIGSSSFFDEKMDFDDVESRTKNARIRDVRIREARFLPPEEDGTPQQIVLEYYYSFTLGRYPSETKILVSKPVQDLKDHLERMQDGLKFGQHIIGSVRHTAGKDAEDILLISSRNRRQPDSGSIGYTYEGERSDIISKIDSLMSQSNRIIAMLETHHELARDEMNRVQDMLADIDRSQLKNDDLRPFLELTQAIGSIQSAVLAEDKELARRIAEMCERIENSSNLTTKAKLTLMLGFICFETKYDLKGIVEAYDDLSFRFYEKSLGLWINIKERVRSRLEYESNSKKIDD